MASMLPGVPPQPSGQAALDPNAMGGPAAQAAPAAPGGEGSPGGDVITITVNGDGTFTVSTQSSDNDPNDPADQPQTLNSVAQVLAAVKAELTEPDANGGSVANPGAWNAAAATRDSSGKRPKGAGPSGSPGPQGGGPSMSM